VKVQQVTTKAEDSKFDLLENFTFDLSLNGDDAESIMLSDSALFISGHGVFVN